MRMLVRLSVFLSFCLPSYAAFVTSSGGSGGSATTDASLLTSGTLANARLDNSSVTLQGNAFNGASQLTQLNGSTQLPAVSGVNLTNLNASNLASGTLPNARLDNSSATLMSNVFNGVSQLVQLNGSTQLPAVSGVNLTNLNASNLASGSVADARLSTNVGLLTSTLTWTGSQTFNSSSTLVQASIVSTSTFIIRDTNASALFSVDNLANIGTDAALSVIANTTAGYDATFSTASASFHVAVSTSGHFVTFGTAPAISSCGSGPNGSVVGDDNQGTITIGGGSVTSCTLTFSFAWGATPSCQISGNSTTITDDISAISATAFTVSSSLSIGGGIIYYHCGCSGASCK